MRIAIAEVVVQRDDRQRRKVYNEQGEFINKDGLLEDIRAVGVLNPIIINAQYVLIAGERRLEASRTLGLRDIPCRFVEDLSPREAERLELSENLKRSELPWRDEVRAVARIHELYAADNLGWTYEDSRQAFAYPNIHLAMRVARELDSPAIAEATNLRHAYNILARKDDRAKADQLNDILDAGGDVLEHIMQGTAPQVVRAEPGAAPPPQQQSTAPSPASTILAAQSGGLAQVEPLLNVSFLEWAPQYEGPRFNFLHCDFPYGIGVFDGEQGRSASADAHYADEEEVYLELLSCLCEHLDRFLAPSAHVLFWLPSDVHLQHETMEYFREAAPSLRFWPKPLVWHKTDNVGVLSDPRRGPRHVYETALIASREDRLIAQATSDAYGAPTNKEYHPSTKPEPMLRYFFQMFVDDNTRMLDPTCGGGSALRAAESLGAKVVLGLERDEAHFANAQRAMRRFRSLQRK